MHNPSSVDRLSVNDSYFRLLHQIGLIDIDEFWSGWSVHGSLYIFFLFFYLPDPPFETGNVGREGDPSLINVFRLEGFSNWMPSIDLIEACVKKCCSFGFHTVVKLLMRFLCLFGIDRFMQIPVQFCLENGKSACIWMLLKCACFNWETACISLQWISKWILNGANIYRIGPVIQYLISWCTLVRMDLVLQKHRCTVNSFMFTHLLIVLRCTKCCGFGPSFSVFNVVEIFVPALICNKDVWRINNRIIRYHFRSIVLSYFNIYKFMETYDLINIS